MREIVIVVTFSIPLVVRRLIVLRYRHVIRTRLSTPACRINDVETPLPLTPGNSDANNAENKEPGTCNYDLLPKAKKKHPHKKQPFGSAQQHAVAARY